MTELDKRYHTDAAFAHLVDCIRALLYNHDFTPTEVRQAAMYACCKHEQTKPHYLIVTQKQAYELGLLTPLPFFPPEKKGSDV